MMQVTDAQLVELLEKAVPPMVLPFVPQIVRVIGDTCEAHHIAIVKMDDLEWALFISRTVHRA